MTVTSAFGSSRLDRAAAFRPAALAPTTTIRMASFPLNGSPFSELRFWCHYTRTRCKTVYSHKTLCHIAGLRELQHSYECMGHVHGQGLMVGVELVKDPDTTQRISDWRNQIIMSSFQKKLLLPGCGKNTVRFYPTLTATVEEIDLCLSLFEEAVREVAG